MAVLQRHSVAHLAQVEPQPSEAGSQRCLDGLSPLPEADMDEGRACSRLDRDETRLGDGRREDVVQVLTRLQRGVPQ